MSTICESRLFKMLNETEKGNEGSLPETSFWISVDHIGHTMIKQNEWFILIFLYIQLLRESSLVWWGWGIRRKLVCLLELVCKWKLAMILNWAGDVSESRWVSGKSFENYTLPPTRLWVSIVHGATFTEANVISCFSCLFRKNKGMRNNPLD